MHNKKETGSYYTPQIMSHFIVEYILNHVKQNEIDVLEPSVGDGAFIKPLSNSPHTINLTAIDINEVALAQAKVIWKRKRSFFLNENFLEYETPNKFDIILGNPPYITKFRMKPTDLELCNKILSSKDLPETTARNLWTSFVIKSESLLKETGILSFVLPAEILQVKFAKPLVTYLSNVFAKIELFTLDDILFDCKGQKVVILFAYKKSKEHGFFFNDNHSMSSIKKGHYGLSKNNALSSGDVKWSNHHIKPDDLSFIYDIKNNIRQVSDYCYAKPGIVTGANKFFIKTKEELIRLQLQKYAIPIIEKGASIRQDFEFTNNNFNTLITSGCKTELLALKHDDAINDELLNYLKTGIEARIHERYKCRKRTIWYVIPNIRSKPTGFFLRRSYRYPKLLMNSSNAFITDTAYVIDMKNSFDMHSFILSFYNSLTLCFCEIEGRKYGGGVLELTPNEFKKLPLLFNLFSIEEFEYLTKESAKYNNIELLTSYIDSKILIESLGLSSNEVKRIINIKNELIIKRMQ